MHVSPNSGSVDQTLCVVCIINAWRRVCRVSRSASRQAPGNHPLKVDNKDLLSADPQVHTDSESVHCRPDDYFRVINNVTVELRKTDVR